MAQSESRFVLGPLFFADANGAHFSSHPILLYSNSKPLGVESGEIRD